MSYKKQAILGAVGVAVVGGVIGTAVILKGSSETAAPPPVVSAAKTMSLAVAPPESGYVVPVSLSPLDSGTDKWVSFALPMPPGVLTSEAAVRVRLVSTGEEIPVFVHSLGNWRGIPPAELRCGGYTPTVPGIRSVLLQFKLTLVAGQSVPILVDVGTTGAKLAAGTPVLSTFRTVNDIGVLYNGSEGYKEPSTIANIDHTWLSCSLLSMMAGQSDQTPELKRMDDSERNFFYTSIGYYKTDWTKPTSDWPVASANNPDLVSSENGVWLYQRPQTFFSTYVRSGLPDAMRSFYEAFWHYKWQIFTEQECVGASYPAYCKGFNRLKTPDKNTPYKDTKYSYAEDFGTYYWLTGDDSVLPYFDWIRAAEDTHGAHQYYHTERFTAYALQAPVIQYEITGSTSALSYATQIVDLLVAKSNANPAGCWVGNDEWGADGFSPWMGPMLMHQLVRYYADKPTDTRVPVMLARVADCIKTHGIAYNSEVEGSSKLLPFYGASSTANPPRDLDGDNPWVGVEHAINVAQGLAIGYMYETDAIKKAALKVAILDLIKSGTWTFDYWTRTTANLPKYRLSPWRKHNWWFHHAGQLQWAVWGKPTIGDSGQSGGGGGGSSCASASGLEDGDIFTPYGAGSFPSNTVEALPWRGAASTYPDGTEDFRGYPTLPVQVECSSDRAERSYVEVTSSCLDAVQITGGDGTLYTRGKVRLVGSDFRALALGYSSTDTTHPIKWTDQGIKFRFLHKGKTADTNFPGFKAMLRYRSENDLYVASWRFDGTIQIQRKWCGVYTTLAILQDQPPPSQDVWHELKFEAKGTTLNFYIDGVLKLTTTVGTFSWGTAGIRIDSADGTYLDDWSIYQPT
jgi:hypothetical protein